MTAVRTKDFRTVALERGTELDFLTQVVSKMRVTLEPTDVVLMTEDRMPLRQWVGTTAKGNRIAMLVYAVGPMLDDPNEWTSIFNLVRPWVS